MKQQDVSRARLRKEMRQQDVSRARPRKQMKQQEDVSEAMSHKVRKKKISSRDKKPINEIQSISAAIPSGSTVERKKDITEARASRQVPALEQSLKDITSDGQALDQRHSFYSDASTKQSLHQTPATEVKSQFGDLEMIEAPRASIPSQAQTENPITSKSTVMAREHSFKFIPKDPYPESEDDDLELLVTGELGSSVSTCVDIVPPTRGEMPIPTPPPMPTSTSGLFPPPEPNSSFALPPPPMPTPTSGSLPPPAPGSSLPPTLDAVQAIGSISSCLPPAMPAHQSYPVTSIDPLPFGSSQTTSFLSNSFGLNPFESMSRTPQPTLPDRLLQKHPTKMVIAEPEPIPAALEVSHPTRGCSVIRTTENSSGSELYWVAVGNYGISPYTTSSFAMEVELAYAPKASGTSHIPTLPPLVSIGWLLVDWDPQNKSICPLIVDSNPSTNFPPCLAASPIQMISLVSKTYDGLYGGHLFEKDIATPYGHDFGYGQVISTEVSIYTVLFGVNFLKTMHVCNEKKKNNNKKHPPHISLILHTIVML